jgi:hypothetical protein
MARLPQRRRFQNLLPLLGLLRANEILAPHLLLRPNSQALRCTEETRPRRRNPHVVRAN